MEFLRGKMGMLTILILILMKRTDGPQVTILPNTEPTVTTLTNTGLPVTIRINTGLPVAILSSTGLPVIIVKACAGENKRLMTKDESAQDDILASYWIFSNIDASITTNNITYCQKEISGRFMVNPLYSNKVEECETTSILLKNISLHDMGYYKSKFLREKMGKTESMSIFLSVSDTPTKQCKPVIRNHSGNMLNCSTQCEQFGVEWRWNKGDVVDNETDLLVDCLWKNESILCCLKSEAMECYKGDILDLCAQIPPSYCTENKPGENGSDIHADKATQHNGTVIMTIMLVLVAIVVLVLLAVAIFHWKRGHNPCRTLRGGNQNVNNADIICSEVLMQNLEGRREAAKDTSDTKSYLEDPILGRTLRGGNQNVNNADVEGEAAKDTSDTKSYLDDPILVVGEFLCMSDNPPYVYSSTTDS